MRDRGPARGVVNGVHTARAPSRKVRVRLLPSVVVITSTSLLRGVCLCPVARVAERVYSKPAALSGQPHAAADAKAAGSPKSGRDHRHCRAPRPDRSSARNGTSLSPGRARRQPALHDSRTPARRRPPCIHATGDVAHNARMVGTGSCAQDRLSAVETIAQLSRTAAHQTTPVEGHCRRADILCLRYRAGRSVFAGLRGVPEAQPRILPVHNSFRIGAANLPRRRLPEFGGSCPL